MSALLLAINTHRNTFETPLYVLSKSDNGSNHLHMCSRKYLAKCMALRASVHHAVPVTMAT
jgi:hypothetical protein